MTNESNGSVNEDQIGALGMTNEQVGRLWADRLAEATEDPEGAKEGLGVGEDEVCTVCGEPRVTADCAYCWRSLHSPKGPRACPQTHRRSRWPAPDPGCSSSPSGGREWQVRCNARR